MASNSKQTESIRKRKSRPNKENLKKEQARVTGNVEVLRKLAREEK